MNTAPQRGQPGAQFTAAVEAAEKKGRVPYDLNEDKDLAVSRVGYIVKTIEGIDDKEIHVLVCPRDKNGEIRTDLTTYVPRVIPLREVDPVKIQEYSDLLKASTSESPNVEVAVKMLIDNLDKL